MNAYAMRLLLLISLAFGGVSASAQPIVDQQQPVIETPGTTLAIGSTFLSRVAQVVTVGTAGTLAAIRLPITCADTPSGYLIVEIQGVDATTGAPDGVILTSQSVLGASLPPFPAAPVFRDIAFSAPASFAAGEQFAIVLSTAESCGVFPGPVGDPYTDGDAFSAGLPDDPNIWFSNCTAAPGARCDVPFQTLVGDPLSCSSSITTTVGLRAEIAALTTSIATLGTLNAHLDRVERLLARANRARARRRLERIIRQAVIQSNLDPSDPDSVPLGEANHLVCSASNVLSGIPLP